LFLALRTINAINKIIIITPIETIAAISQLFNLAFTRNSSVEKSVTSLDRKLAVRRYLLSGETAMDTGYKDPLGSR